MSMEINLDGVVSIEDSIEDFLSGYKLAAQGTSNSDPRLENGSHEVMHAYYKRLRESEAGWAE